MIEFDKVTTRGGDRGESSLSNGERRRKDDIVFHAMGDVDEANVAIGIGRALLRDGRTKETLHTCQLILFKVGSQIATPRHDTLYAQLKEVTAQDLDWLESIEKKLLDRVRIGSAFVVPGDTIAGAHIDYARAVVRRAERTIVACIRDRHMDHLILCQNFLNRLSDYLFVLSRAVDQEIVS